MQKISAEESVWQSREKMELRVKIKLVLEDSRFCTKGKSKEIRLVLGAIFFSQGNASAGQGLRLRN